MTGALLPLASFNFEIPPIPAKNIGKKGTEQWLPLSKLRIDDSYQRPIDASGKKTIRGIIENFRWHKFAPLVVAKRPGGLFAVVDGQHRAVACALHGGIKEVPCHVLACSPEEEAAAFATINGIVTRMHPQYLFRARIASGDPGAVAANAAAAAAGVRIMPYPAAASQLKVGETLSGKTIETELTRVGRDVVVAALELITRTGSGNAGLVKAAIIEGFCDVYAAHPKWLSQQEECRRVVNRKGVKQILADAMKVQAEKGGTLRAAVGADLSATLFETLGDGGKIAVVTGKAIARSEAKKGIVPRAFQKLGGSAGNVHKLSKADLRKYDRKVEAPKAQVTASERALIDAHLASKGARRFESGANGNTSNLLDWLNMNGHKAARRGAKFSKPYVIDGRFYDMAGLFTVVNRTRKKKGLEPIILDPEQIKIKKRTAAEVFA